MVNELLLRKSHGDKEDTKIDPSPLDAVSATPRVTAPIGIGEKQALKNGQEGCSLYINLDLIFLKNIFKDADEYTYPYRETNRQSYVLKKDRDGWKVFENLRPLPRTYIPYRWSRRTKINK